MTCTWCAHPAHTTTCTKEIQTGTAKDPQKQPCPCAYHLLSRGRDNS